MFSCCCCFYICIIEHIERYLSPVCAVCCSFKVRKLSDKMTYLNKTNLLTIIISHYPSQRSSYYLAVVPG